MSHAAAYRHMGLEDQVVIVTGSTSGIGRACAIAYGRAGAKVVVNGRDKPASRAEAEETAHEIEKAGGRAMLGMADVSSEDEVEAMFASAVDRFGTVHALLANSGIQDGAPFAEMPEAFRRLQAQLLRRPGGEREMVDILALVLQRSLVFVGGDAHQARHLGLRRGQRASGGRRGDL